MTIVTTKIITVLRMVMKPIIMMKISDNNDNNDDSGR